MHFLVVVTSSLTQDFLNMEFAIKGRFLLFQVYRNFAKAFSNLSVSTFDKEMSKFQQKVQM